MARKKTIASDTSLAGRRNRRTKNAILVGRSVSLEDKPATVEHYTWWLRERHNVDFPRAEAHYDSVTRKICADVEASPCWQAIIADLRRMDQEYLVNTTYNLLVEGSLTPQLLTKPFGSFIVKTFRQNILDNPRWPDEPAATGWILPPSWFEQINDIVRSLLVVKYLDGVTFAADQIFKIAKNLDTTCSTELKARDEGYYAAHLYFPVSCEIPRENWDTEKANILVEIQITTQVQEVIRKLLHTYYEERRITREQESAVWQWNYKSPEFSANYLGHVLHYVEGMIMDIREKQERKRS